ncbi:MAG TPA: hypothetical protein VF426_13490 [Marmoricola sp.]
MRRRTSPLLPALLAALLTALLVLPAAGTAHAATVSVPAPVAAGSGFSLMLAPGGVPLAVGDNSRGQLGTGDTVERSTPTPMTGLPTKVSARAVSAGADHSLVLGSDGKAYAVGGNGYGELGTGDNVDRHRLTRMRGLPRGTSAVALSAGSLRSLVLASNGIAYATGADSAGQLATGGTVDRHVLRPMLGLPSGVRATRIAAGPGTHSLVLGSNGVPYATGWNYNGQLATGDSNERDTLTAMTGLPAGVRGTAVAAGADFSLVLGSDGVVYGAGNNNVGQLGTRNRRARTSLVAMKGLPRGVLAVAVDAGDYHSFVLASNGKAYATGFDAAGQLGIGLTANRLHLVAVKGLPTGVTAVAVAAGPSHSLVLGSDHVVYAAGNDDSGELGTAIGADPRVLAAMLEPTLTITAWPHGTGVPMVGRTLTVDSGSWTVAPTTVDYRWLRDGQPIDGVNGHSYRVRPVDAGHQVSVTVTAHRSGFHDGVATTGAVPISLGVLTVRVRPRTTGTATYGNTLRATTGTWSASVRTTVQWLRDGQSIPRAASRTYRLRRADIGHHIAVRVTATAPGYRKATAVSVRTRKCHAAP